MVRVSSVFGVGVDEGSVYVFVSLCVSFAPPNSWFTYGSPTVSKKDEP